MSDALLSALMPAIGQLASWLIGLLIKKLGGNADLIRAQAAIRNVLMKEKMKKQTVHNKHHKETGMKSITIMICAIVVLIVVSLWAYHAKADPVTTNAGKSTTVQAVIPSGGTTSAAIDLGAFQLVGINMPSAFTSVSISFLMSNSPSGPWQPVYNQAGQVIEMVAAGRYYALPNVTDFQGIRYLEVVASGTEAAARTLTLSIKTQY